MMPLECLHCGHYLPHVGEGIPGPNFLICVGDDDRHMPAILLKDDFGDGCAEATTNRLLCDAIHRGKR